MRPGVTSSLTRLGRDNTHMKNSSFTPTHVRYLYAGICTSVVFVLSLIGEIWFLASAGRAKALLGGNAPLETNTVVALFAVLLFGSLWLTIKAFERAGKETLSMCSFVGGIIILLAVGQLWHFAM